MAEQTLEELALQAAIENLYEVFSVYPMPVNMTGCICCLTEEEVRPLKSKPLRELTPDELWKYNISAMATWGTETDYKYFLPRLLELLKDADMTMVKLEGCDLPTWPVSEQQALAQFLSSRWEAQLVTPFSYLKLLLQEAVKFLKELQPFLLVWQQKLKAGNKVALENLLDFIDEAEYELNIDYFLVYDRTQTDIIVNWLLGEDMNNVLQEIFFKYADDPDQAEFATQLSAALEQRERLRKIPKPELSGS